MSKELTPTEKKIVDCFTRTQIICKLFEVACAAEGGFSIAATLVSANEMLDVVRDQKACILEWLKENKFWPACARVDNGWGDRNLAPTCVDFC